MPETQVSTDSPCEYFMYFSRQHPNREVRTCDSPVRYRVFYIKGNRNILACSRHATRIRSANSAYIASSQQKGQN